MVPVDQRGTRCIAQHIGERLAALATDVRCIFSIIF